MRTNGIAVRVDDGIVYKTTLAAFVTLSLAPISGHVAVRERVKREGIVMFQGHKFELIGKPRQGLPVAGSTRPVGPNQHAKYVFDNRPRYSVEDFTYIPHKNRFLCRQNGIMFIEHYLNLCCAPKQLGKGKSAQFVKPSEWLKRVAAGTNNQTLEL